MFSAPFPMFQEYATMTSAPVITAPRAGIGLGTGHQPEITFYPYGVQYYRAPTPRPEEWAGDLHEIYRSGFKLIQLRPQWRTHERHRGKIVWDDIDRLMELAGQNELKVIIKPMLECAPDWVYTELDGSRRTFGGQKLLPQAIGAFYVGGWLPCFDNPKVQSAAIDFVKAIARRYSGNERLFLWNAWNEPRSRPLGECQCEYSIESYRQYLTKRFGTIETLNEQFGKAWSDFSTVMPPVSGRDYAEMFLWRQWAFEVVAQRVRMVAETIRNIDKSHSVMAHVGCSTIIQDIACDSSDDHLTAKTVDFYGCSLPINIYPKTMKDACMGSMICDWLRSVDKNFWCHEIYPTGAGWNPSPKKSFQARQLWTALSCGAKGLVYWQYRSERLGNESNGHGLREINGAPTERSEAAEEFASVLSKEGEQFTKTTVPHPKIAVLYDRQCDLLSRIQCMHNDLAREEIKTDYTYKQAVQGTYLGLWLTDIRADWISTNQLHRIEHYSCIIASALELADRQMINALKAFVEQGGKLIVEFPFACRGENTWVLPDRPGLGMDKLLGVREKQRLNIDREDIILPDNEMFSVSDTKVVFELAADADVLGHWGDGTAALVRNTYGKGQVLSIGGSLSIRTLTQESQSDRQQWERLLDLLGIEACSILSDRWTGLESRILESDRFRYLILINHSTNAGQIEMPVDFRHCNWDYVIGGNESKNEKTHYIHIPAEKVVCLRIDKENKNVQ